MVEKKEALRVTEATRIAREVRIGGRGHRLEVVLEHGRTGRYYVDAVPAAAADFDRVIRLASLVETISER